MLLITLWGLWGIASFICMLYLVWAEWIGLLDSPKRSPKEFTAGDWIILVGLSILWPVVVTYTIHRVIWPTLIKSRYIKRGK